MFRELHFHATWLTLWARANRGGELSITLQLLVGAHVSATGEPGNS